MTPFNRIFTTMTKPAFAAIYFVLILLSYFYFDPAIASYFHKVDLRTNLPVLNWITKIGIGGLYYIPIFLLALFFRYIGRNRLWEARMWFLWLCIAIGGLICSVIKIVAGRARPALLFEDNLYGFYGLQFHAPFWSFPSGHVTTIMSVAFGLSVLFPRGGYTIIFAGFLVSCTRVLLTHHYLSDILAAGYFALLEVGLLLWFLRRKSWLEPAYTHRI